MTVSWIGFDFRGCRLKEVERDVLCELKCAGVDLADVGTGVGFCSLIDDKEGLVAVCVTCVVRVFTRLSFLRATTLSFAKQISIEEHTVERDMCWSKIVFT